MSYKVKDMWPFSCRGNFSVIVKQKANLTCSAGGRCKENVGKYVLLALGDSKHSLAQAKMNWKNCVLYKFATKKNGILKQLATEISPFDNYLAIYELYIDLPLRNVHNYN